MTNKFDVDSLLVSFLAGTATPNQAILLEDWANHSAANKAWLTIMLKTFGSDQQDTYPASWDKILMAIHATETPTKKFSFQWITGIAASLLIAILATVFLTREHKKIGPPVTYKTASTLLDITLIDGSQIQLAAFSTLTPDKGFGKINRTVKLKGSGAFSIIHDSLKPFIISIGKLNVKDLGTLFSIKSAPDTVTIVVELGKVSVYDSGHAAVLGNGDKAYYLISKKILTVVSKALPPVKTNLKEKPKNKPPTIIPSNRPFVYRDSTIAIITETEAGNILGARASLVNHDSNGNDGIVQNKWEYQAGTDQRLYYTIDYYLNASAAHNSYQALYLKTPAAAIIKGIGAEAFYFYNASGGYVLAFRKNSLVFKATIGRLTKQTSTRNLVNAAKRLSQVLQ